MAERSGLQQVLCWNCRTRTEYTIKSRKSVRVIKGTEYTYHEQYAVCNTCGEEVMVPGLSDANEHELDNLYRRNHGLITIDDIYALPDGKRAELIDGQLYYMAPPNTKHQRILSFLHLEIGNYIRENKGTCEVFPAPFAVFLSADNSKYLEPDISVICDINKLNDHGCHGAPDWVIEIVSPRLLTQ